MTPQWHHKWRHVKNTKITKNRQNRGFSLFFQAKVAFFGNDVCQSILTHVLTPNKPNNKIKHSEKVSWKQKTRFVCNFHWKSVFGQFFVGPSAPLPGADPHMVRIGTGPPFWQINHANSAYFRLFLGYFRVISATRPPLLDLGLPFLHILDPPLITQRRVITLGPIFKKMVLR